MRRDPHRAGRGQAIATSSPMPSRACSSTGNRPRPTLRRRCVTTSVFVTTSAFATMCVCATRPTTGTRLGPRSWARWSAASALRRALSIVPLAVIGYVIAWFLYFEPSQNVTAKSAVEAKPEVIQAAAPVVPPPPPVAEAKPAPTPAPAATATPASAPPPSPSPRRRGPCRKTRSRSCRASSVPPVSPRDRSTASSGRRRRRPFGATPSRAASPSRRSRRRRRCFGCARKPRPRSSSRITARSQRRRRRLPNLARTAGAGRCVQS